MSRTIVCFRWSGLIQPKSQEEEKIVGNEFVEKVV